MSIMDADTGENQIFLAWSLKCFNSTFGKWGSRMLPEVEEDLGIQGLSLICVCTNVSIPYLRVSLLSHQYPQLTVRDLNGRV